MVATLSEKIFVWREMFTFVNFRCLESLKDGTALKRNIKFITVNKTYSICYRPTIGGPPFAFEKVWCAKDCKEIKCVFKADQFARLEHHFLVAHGRGGCG